jgi:hypothetical protein
MEAALMRDDDNLCFAIPTYRLRDVSETVEQYDEHFWRKDEHIVPPPPPPPPLACRSMIAHVEARKTPFDINITLTATPPKTTAVVQPKESLGARRASPAGYLRPVNFVSQGPNLLASDPPAPAAQPSKSDCSSAPCTITRTIRSADKEYWDLGMGLSIPGVLEPQYAPTNPTLQIHAARHSEIYGFLNFFPLARWADKTSLAPNITLGVPVTGKVFFRPFFGVGESLNGWKPLGSRLPLQIDIIAGFTFLNQEIAEPGQPGPLAIQRERVWKPMFGIEVPVSALISKITQIGGGNKSSTSTPSK